tara:strand:+ start:648 stop:917 length:270 start_codon:yes stop_codon:yes gene_type:complete
MAPWSSILLGQGGDGSSLPPSPLALLLLLLLVVVVLNGMGHSMYLGMVVMMVMTHGMAPQVANWVSEVAQCHAVFVNIFETLSFAHSWG